ncbi:MAG: aminoacyl-tRNA hydrolase [Parachlamydiales bacterium]|nr:aminoacyl-tRNA hydrolase [Parachlamydiales bacterium]
MSEKRVLIAGLGNPGKKYENTRHNIGFLVVQSLARRLGILWKEDPQLQGAVAKGTVGKRHVLLLMPNTYMNLSGEAVRKCQEYYKVDIDDMLIIIDDIHVPFGEMRLKKDSGTGGHKGLQSVSEHVRSQAYPRLRIGIGKEEDVLLVDYVLSRFSKEESQLLPEIIERSVDMVLLWLEQGIEKAMNLANIRKKREEENL